MNLCIDQGNSSVKIGAFDQHNLIDTYRYENFDKETFEFLFNKYKFDYCIISSVKNNEAEIQSFMAESGISTYILSEHTLLPFEMGYDTPATLGKDRIAVVAGAAYLKPATDCLIIDAGTAITYDFIDKNSYYHGGNIAPGVDLRFLSLYQNTGKLPLVQANEQYSFLGKNTESAILNGVMTGILFEIQSYIDQLKLKHINLSVFLTGGDAFYFEKGLKNTIFAEKNLVLIGLNRILQFNVQK